MTLKTLAAVACLSICTATAGLAAAVTVDGIGYDVTTITGTFSDNEALLMGQVWWGDFSLAYKFTTAVGVNLGTPNSFLGVSSGPYFFSTVSGGRFALSAALDGRAGSVTTIGPETTRKATYAIATPVSAVPLPAGGLLLVSAFGGIAALKRRKKGSA